MMVKGYFVPALAVWVHSLRIGRRKQANWLTAALLIAGLEAVIAQELPRRHSVEICLAVNHSLSLGTHLLHTAERLRASQPLTVVVIGSSSTVGLWVFGTATYPEVMRRELSRLLTSARIVVINSGRVGDTIPRTLARLQRDVLSHQPDLVVLQLGTNDVVWGGRPEGVKEQIIQGVRTLKAGGADVILMDLQYTPVVLASSQHALMQTIIREVARQERVGLFPRFDLMRRSFKAGVPRGALVSLDMLHNSAEGYECIGRALARSIHAAAR